jgi:hypothetical protein
MAGGDRLPIFYGFPNLHLQVVESAISVVWLMCEGRIDDEYRRVIYER